MAETFPTTAPAGALPDEFAPMAARALDFAAQQVETLVRTRPDMFPIFTVGGRWQIEEEAWTTRSSSAGSPSMSYHRFHVEMNRNPRSWTVRSKRRGSISRL